MRVAIAHSNPKVRERIAGLISPQGHVVRALTDCSWILDNLDGPRRPDVAVVELTARAGLDDAVRTLCRAQPHVYVIAVVPDLKATFVQTAYEAGVDDVMSARASGVEVAGRVGALTRIRRWVGSMGVGFASSDEGFDLAALGVWNDLPSLLSSEFSQMLGVKLEIRTVDVLPTLAQSAEIQLTLASETSTASVGIGLEESGAPGFGRAVFGEEVLADVLADAIREFANGAGGAIKRGALTEGYTFSLGLPKMVPPPSLPDDSQVFELHHEDLHLWVWASGGAAKPSRVAASLLKEGMVLAREIRTQSGTLLVTAGSVVTERTVARLVRVVGPTALVDVLCAA
ncbi:MAG: hypothetical protein KTR31_33620 [Myxococcales bacterium]|nr:hypothetical protein [Myxococcales bacterium]